MEVEVEVAEAEVVVAGMGEEGAEEAFSAPHIVCICDCALCFCFCLLSGEPAPSPELDGAFVRSDLRMSLSM